METYIIPPINTEGIFNIASPFWKEEYDNLTMKLVEIRNIQEMLNANIKVFELIYEPVGLSKSDYEDDINNEVPILSFSNSKREHIYIPADRLSSVPDISGIRYQSQILTFNLGLLPIDFNNDALVKNIVDIVESTIGVTPKTKTLLNSGIHMVSEDDDELYTTTRTSKIKSNENIYGKYNTLLKNYDMVLEYLKKSIKKIEELETKLLMGGSGSTEEYNRLTAQLTNSSDTVTKLNAKIDSLEKLINTLKTNVATNATNINNLRNSIDNINTGVTDTTIDNKIKQLENKLTTLINNFNTTLTNSLNELKTRVSKIERDGCGKANSLQNQINTLSNTITEQTNLINNLKNIMTRNGITI